MRTNENPAPAGSSRFQPAPAGSSRLQLVPAGSSQFQTAPAGSRRLQPVTATDFTQKIDILQNVCEEVKHITIQKYNFFVKKTYPLTLLSFSQLRYSLEQ
jgi:hypothetical protein